MAERITTSKAAGRLTDHISIGVLARTIPRDIVDDVLAETGTREKRKRLLPAHVVVYFVVALALFRASYEETLRQLVGGLRFLRNWDQGWVVPTSGAVCQARARLGAAPLRVLFERVAVPLAGPGTVGGWLRGWRLMAIDGVQIDVPDTPANVAAFGKATGGTRRPYPQIRSVGLGECGTHAVIAAATAGLHTGERELAEALTGAVERDMLVLADRGFFSFATWTEYMITGAALLWRVSATITLEPTEVLPDGSYLSMIMKKRARAGAYEIPLSAVTDPREATHVPVRVVEYTVGGTGTDEPETFRLVTTVLDPAELSAIEMATAYQQRWEYELSLREIETQLLEPGYGLRSKTPEMVEQEFWGLLIAHYAVRAIMADAADNAGIDPDRLSFKRSLNVIRRQVTNQAGFSPRSTQTRTR